MSASSAMRVNDLVQAPPALSAEPAHHAIGRGRGQRGKAQPGHRADDQINAVRDFVDDFPEAVALIGEEQREMRGDVAERPDAEHAAHIDQIAVAENAPKRRHCQRHPEKHQRPESGAVNEFVERPRTVRDLVRLERLPWRAASAAMQAYRRAATTDGRAGRATIANGLRHRARSLAADMFAIMTYCLRSPQFPRSPMHGCNAAMHNLHV